MESYSIQPLNFHPIKQTPLLLCTVSLNVSLLAFLVNSLSQPSATIYHVDRENLNHPSPRGGALLISSVSVRAMCPQNPE